MLGRERRTYKEEIWEDKELKEIIELGRKHRQLGLYLFLTKKGATSFADLYAIYSMFSRHRPTPETVRHQLKLLERKGLIKKEGEEYKPIKIPPEALRGLFDVARSRAGRWGSYKALMHYLHIKYSNKELPVVKDISPKLRKKLSEVLETAEELVKQGEGEAALDLLVHTFLPVRQTGVLWLWKGDEFIYYERKTMTGGSFHSVKFPLLSQLLKNLGFEEGIMCYHVLGDQESRRILRKIFGYEDTYPYARSIFYSLKRFGIAWEGEQHLLEMWYSNITIQLILKTLEGHTIQSFTLPWQGQPPPPLEREGEKRTYLTLGVQHIKESNEGSYFSRF